MCNVLLDDALLECVVTEVVLFSIVAFKTLTFECGGIFSDNIITNVLPIQTVK